VTQPDSPPSKADPIVAKSPETSAITKRIWQLWLALNRAIAGLMRHPVLTAIGSLLIFLIALRVINQELTKYSLADLQKAVDDIGFLTLLGAVVAAVISYAALVFADRYALAMLGKRLPYARTARASLAAYALANTLGYSWATAATARQRLYRKWGLLPGEIGALSFVTGTAVQIGGLAAAGLGLLVAAQEVALHGPLNSGFWLFVGLVILVPAALWLVYAEHGPLKADFTGAPLLRPKPANAVAHLSAVIIDWIGAAAVLYILLPNHGGWTFPAFLAVFVLAGMLGALSGAPGGLGVFEAAILTLAPVTQEAPGAAIALILYRLMYNIIPLGVATLILGIDQAAPAARPAARVAVKVGSGLSARIGLRVGSSLGEATLEFSPRILAALVFAAGLVLLASVATPSLTDRIKILHAWDLHAISELSHFGASIVGVALLIVASGLWKKVNAAWAVSLILLAAGIVFSLIKGLDWEEASALACVFAVMLPCKSAFNRNSRLGLTLVSPKWIAAILGAVAASGWLALFAYQHVEFRAELWWEFVRDSDAARSLRALTGACIFALLLAIWALVRPLRGLGRASATAEDIAKVQAILATTKGLRADANLALLGDKSFLFSDSQKSFIMFRPRGNRWIAYGEPVGLPEERQELLLKMRDASDQGDARPVYYAVSRDCVADFAAFGYGVRKIGETAIIDLTTFDIVGKAMQNLRTARNKLAKEGASFTVAPASDTPTLLTEMAGVSAAWLASQKGSEKTFSLGSFSNTYLSYFSTAIVRGEDGRMLAFANLWVSGDNHEIAIDLMRYSPDAPKNVMDFLFVEIALWAKAGGFKRFDLAMAPLSGLEDQKGAPFLMRFGAIMFEEGEAFYGFRGLRQFKNKFNPNWEPLYLCAPPDVLMTRALFDVAVLTSGGFKGLVGDT
jgi:phosphatidylglycerol lysyltransferase